MARKKAFDMASMSRTSTKVFALEGGAGMRAGRPPLVPSPLNRKAALHTSCFCPRSCSMRSDSWPRSTRL